MRIQVPANLANRLQMGIFVGCALFLFGVMGTVALTLSHQRTEVAYSDPIIIDATGTVAKVKPIYIDPRAELAVVNAKIEKAQ